MLMTETKQQKTKGKDATMIKYYCDNCREEQDSKEALSRVEIRVTDNEYIDNDCSSLELCETCMLELGFKKNMNFVKLEEGLSEDKQALFRFVRNLLELEERLEAGSLQTTDRPPNIMQKKL